MKIVSNEEILSLGISADMCMKWIRESFLQKHDAQLPPKISLHPQGSDFFNTMPCMLPPATHRFAVKVVNRIEGNHPSLHADILLYDSRTGKLLSLMDGDWITSMRTGAVAALSAMLFQTDGNDTYSFIGLGNTAQAAAKCILSSRSGKKTRFRLMRYKDQAEKFAHIFRHPDVECEIVGSIEELVAGASVLISCITSADGLLCADDSLFGSGIVVIPVHTRGFQNCDLFFDRVIGDDTGHICGFKYFDRFRRFDELSSVLRSEAPGRRSADERILCYNIGLGLHDAVYSSHIYDMLQGR